MFALQAEATFDAAHFLQGHEGACRNLHGHRWRVVLEIEGAQPGTSGPARDMLLDFADVKHILRNLAAGLDHKMIYEAGSLRPQTVAALKDEGFALVELPFRPTAERLSEWFYHKLAAAGIAPAKVWVYETPENRAAYWE
ncbi:MAG: 6-carboxytetrahydropterin synthase [Firmicutes bacterium]|nr:6-carboxytetrahydropterin synthase [Bacillota bacterium]